MINLIIACDAKGGIASNGTLPWPKNSKDLAWFKRHTSQCTVIMGSKTWQDPFMPSPLPSRYNVVVTTRPEDNEGADEYISGDILKELLRIEQERADENRPIWVIGGADIVKQVIPHIDRIYLIIMDKEYKCDTFIPLKDILRTHTELASESAEGMTVKILEKFSTGLK